MLTGEEGIKVRLTFYNFLRAFEKKRKKKSQGRNWPPFEGVVDYSFVLLEVAVTTIINCVVNSIGPFCWTFVMLVESTML